MCKLANIIVDINSESVNRPFTYIIPDNLTSNVYIGCKVIIPFGKANKQIEGFVINIIDETNSEIDKSKLKYIECIAKNKISINDILIKIAIFLSKEYLTPLTTCLKTVLPIKRQVRKNARQVDVAKEYERQIDTDVNITLNEQQQKVLDDIISESKKNNIYEHLIFGITGSGKTEVYIKLIEEVLKEKKKAIVLIPEISLTYQTVVRLSKHFASKIAIIHSKMSEGEKYIQYNKCLNDEIDILVGPRSAIFAPFENLGLIIIDEEHDMSYKSETSPRYDTIEVAEYRAKEQNALLVMGSATPSLKNYKRALNNEISLHKIEHRANENATLPKVHVVDLREEFKNKNKSVFSKKLHELIEEKLEKKEQIMLFMNRRGYSNFINCRDCGETIKCPHCSVALTLHKNATLKCHYCGYEIKEPLICPNCKSTHISSLGVGTEKLETLTKKEFPNARVQRMDADTTSIKGSLDKIIKDFKDKKIDILIGTQMIVKGHDFPNVTLVGIMAADTSLYISDFKSAERTFQLLTQCAGRSGRNKNGDVVIQSYDTEHYAIQYAAEQNYEAFYNEEIKFRELLNYPPNTFMFVMVIQSKDEMLLSKICEDVKTYVNTKFEIDEFYGPQKAPIYKIKDVYRNVFYIKHIDKEYLKNIRFDLLEWLKNKKESNLIKVVFDIL